MRSSTKRNERMEFWADRKRSHGRRGWKAAKKRIRRNQRDTRRNRRAALNALIDNGLVAA